MANSGTVTAGSAALASQYNNLRDDVLNTSSGHTHTGASENGAQIEGTAIKSTGATNAYVLTANGSNAATWAAVSAGGMTAIGTATPSAATTISFTSIPNSYKHLFLVWRLYQSVNTGVFAVRLNNNSGTAYYGSFVHQLGTNTRVFDTIDNDRIGSTFDINGSPVQKTDTSSTAYESHSNGVLSIFNYTNTTECAWEASGRAYSSASGNSGWRSVEMRGIYRTGGTAVNRIDFVRNSTQTITGTVYLYGVS